MGRPETPLKKAVRALALAAFIDWYVIALLVRRVKVMAEWVPDEDIDAPKDEDDADRLPYQGDGPASGLCLRCAAMRYPVYETYEGKLCLRHFKEMIGRGTWPSPPRNLYDR